ncbi:uncharacterized protein LOC124280089 [Haliotis rubra]|uniref:uncharacterized protein LOC124280089 n=1 Tax=Haliotis rubra TaxID=36100 RepID=UPI001EE5FDCE|nr:uncharacterized protein LOC124280089 [Haliotis rubra]
MGSRWMLQYAIVIGLRLACGVIVNTTDRTAVEGWNPVDITCSFSLSEGEEVDYVYIDTYVDSIGFVDLVNFWPLNTTTEYLPGGARLRNRTTLVVEDGQVALRFNVVECGDATSYYCNVQTNVTYAYEGMDLQVVGPISKPKIIIPTGCYDDGQDLDVACLGAVRGSDAEFKWYGYREGRDPVDLTPYADRGAPYQPDGKCGYKLVTHLKVNLTSEDDGMVLRCVLSDQTEGLSPSPRDLCGEYCTDTDNLTMSAPLSKPTLTVSKTAGCVGDSVTFHCSGPVGDPSRSFTWTARRPRQVPVDLTSLSDPGYPYRRLGSCTYERHSHLTLTLVQADQEMSVRCEVSHRSLHISEGDSCGLYCSESERISLADATTCGCSAKLFNVFIVVCSLILVRLHHDELLV